MKATLSNLPVQAPSDQAEIVALLRLIHLELRRINASLDYVWPKKPKDRP